MGGTKKLRTHSQPSCKKDIQGNQKREVSNGNLHTSRHYNTAQEKERELLIPHNRIEDRRQQEFEKIKHSISICILGIECCIGCIPKRASIILTS